MDETKAETGHDAGDRWARVLRPAVAGLMAIAIGGSMGALLALTLDTGERTAASAPAAVPETETEVAVALSNTPSAAPMSAAPPRPAGPPTVAAPARGAPDWLSEPKAAPLMTSAPPLVERPAGELDDEIARLIERQDAPNYEEPAVLDEAAAPLPAKPSDREIDAALAALDFSVFARMGEAGDPPAWRRHAAAVEPQGDGPAIALVIDDLGLNRRNSRRAIALPAPLTLAFMTYSDELQDFADSARAAGHELLVHVPMAPRDPSNDPGPNVLDAELGPAELTRRLSWGLSRFEGYVGINNHMGSGFTTSLPGMMQVMAALKARGLLYFDSLTIPGSLSGDLASRLDVPYARRDIFIDNDPEDREAIYRQLVRLEGIAARYGSAVGIGHPHTATLEVLARWLPEARKRGFRLVPISALVRTDEGLAVSPTASAQPG